MKSNKNFIYTNDAHVAEQLRNMGLKEITSSSEFVFLNDPSQKPVTFSEVDTAKLVFTDHLCL